MQTTKQDLEVYPFNLEWNYRSEIIKNWIPENSTVLDLGAGTQGIKKYVNFKKYIPVDKYAVTPDTIVCDFSVEDLPFLEDKFDLVMAMGLFEYLKPNRVLQMFKEIPRYSDTLIFSYYERRSKLLRWTALHTFQQIENWMTRTGWIIQKMTTTTQNNQRIYLCKHQDTNF